jgi:protein-tyrosine phosphatase
LAALRVDSVVSLLTASEEDDLDLRNEAAAAKVQGMKFTSFPIPDREVPNSESELAAVLERVDNDLSSGKNVLVHCRQGIGRSGLVAACLLGHQRAFARSGCGQSEQCAWIAGA